MTPYRNQCMSCVSPHPSETLTVLQNMNYMNSKQKKPIRKNNICIASNMFVDPRPDRSVIYQTNCTLKLQETHSLATSLVRVYIRLIHTYIHQLYSLDPHLHS